MFRFSQLLVSYYMERGKRIELSALAWKAKVLPLYEPRIFLFHKTYIK